MNPNWDQLRQWALLLDPTNQMHVALLKDCARTIGVSDNGAFDRVRQRVLGHIAAQADQTAQATYTPLGWTPPAPVQPAQPQPAAPAVVTPPPAAQPPQAPPAPPAQTVQQQPAARRPLPNWVWPLIAAAAITAAAVIGLIFALRYDNGSNGSTASSISVSGSSGQSAQSPAGNKNGSNGADNNVPANGASSGSALADKCEWLRSHFPQTTASVQALGAKLANVQPNRIATHLYPCDATNTVFDGFIVLGPGEGYSGSFTLTVPDHGAVDSYPGATFSGNNHRIGAETIRATSGKVTAVRATYWPWLDENPPSAQTTGYAPNVTPVADQPTAAPTCVDPTALATSRGWNNLGWSDQKYGGLRVQLSNSDTLPDKWEALTSGSGIHESDTNRQMSPGTWTIYPPFACRESLGYSK